MAHKKQQEMDFEEIGFTNEHLSNDSLDEQKNLMLDLDKMESLSSIADKSVLPNNKMTIWQTSLAMVAANIGGGILGLGYAFYHLGLFLGLIVLFVMSVSTHLSNVLHLKIKDLTPRKYESLYEIAYLLYGRASIFVVCINMLLTNLGAIVMYFIIIGDTLSSLVTQALVGNPSNGKAASLDNEEWWV